MGKYRSLGVSMDRNYRNDLNANFDDVDTDIQLQKGRVDTLIQQTPQPDEILDVRVRNDGTSATTAGEHVRELGADITEKSNLTNKKIYLENEGLTDSAYQFEIANFGGSDGISRRAFVVHHYNDAEMCVLDNVGENNVIMLLRNATNATRRPDKPADFVGTGDFLRAQGRYKNADGTWQAVTLFELKENGDLNWGNKGPLDNDGVRLINAQPSSNDNFAFTLKNVTRNEKILDIQHESGKSALYVTTNSGNRLDIYPSSHMAGMKLLATNGNMEIEAGVDSVSGASKFIQLRSPAYSLTPSGSWAQLARFVPKPASATAQGERGDYFCDTQYLYVCQGPNSWVRVAVSTW